MNQKPILQQLKEIAPLLFSPGAGTLLWPSDPLVLGKKASYFSPSIAMDFACHTHAGHKLSLPMGCASLLACQSDQTSNNYFY